jgi:hypothetical protein
LVALLCLLPDGLDPFFKSWLDSPVKNANPTSLNVGCKLNGSVYVGWVVIWRQFFDLLLVEVVGVKESHARAEYVDEGKSGMLNGLDNDFRQFPSPRRKLTGNESGAVKDG